MSGKPPDQHIQHVLRQALVYGKHNAPAVARRSGLGYDLLAKLWSGHRHLHVDHLAGLYRGTQDVGLISELCSFSDLGLVLAQRGEATGGHRRPEAITLAIASAAGRVAELVADAQLDDSISESEAEEILVGLDALERKAVALRTRLKVVGAGE